MAQKASIPDESRWATQDDLEEVKEAVETGFSQIHRELAWLKRHVRLIVCLLIATTAIIISNSAGHGPAGWRVFATVLAAMAVTAAWEYLYAAWT